MPVTIKVGGLAKPKIKRSRHRNVNYVATSPEVLIPQEASLPVRGDFKIIFHSLNLMIVRQNGQLFLLGDGIRLVDCQCDGVPAKQVVVQNGQIA